MKHEPQAFANLDGVMVVKVLERRVNLSDCGVAHLAQNNLDLDRLARRGAHEVARHVKRGQGRIGTANQKPQTHLDNSPIINPENFWWRQKKRPFERKFIDKVKE